jgi:hypothetical protein
VLFVAGLNVPAWIFFSLGLLGAVFRLGLKMQEEQQKTAVVKEGVDLLKDSADEFLNSLNEALGKKSGKKRSNLN